MADSWLRGDWMQTHSGVQFYPMDPRAEEIDPGDVAHALSLICRYGGHVDRFYSVAEHCVLMSEVVPAEHALWALLHDATEAYVGDMVRPLKRQLPDYCAAEDRVMVAVAERFGLPSAEMPPEVKDGRAAGSAVRLGSTTPVLSVSLVPAPRRDGNSEPEGSTSEQPARSLDRGGLRRSTGLSRRAGRRKR